ncbi:MAG TPA: choice-of-anchor P family protein, partial [Candidatus Dormibacteraeota bacterium]|nr:choice-of-anchor P family protein [Candidatus Dormibacteraeota bacterium]
REMTYPGRFPRRAALAVALLTTGLVCGARALPAHAAAGVTTVDGSAYGYRAFGISLFGGAQPDTGPTPTVALASNASNSPQSATATTGVVAYGPATMLTTDGISVSTSGSIGATGSETSSSTVTDLNKSTTNPTTTGSEALTADSLSATCSASASATSGSTTATNATVVTDNSTTPPTVTSVPANPAANTTISGKIVISATDTETFSYVFNEQTTDAAGNLTVNAVDEYFLGPTAKGNLIVGQAVCGESLGADLSLQNPGITHTPDPVPGGGMVTFTITVNNLGPSSAPGVVDTVSVTGGRMASVTSAAGPCATSKGKTRGTSCSLGTLASGQTATVLVTVNAGNKAGGTIAVSSTVSSPADTNLTNNTATDSVKVQ